jgi:hypothetical protein
MLTMSIPLAEDVQAWTLGERNLRHLASETAEETPLLSTTASTAPCWKLCADSFDAASTQR